MCGTSLGTLKNEAVPLAAGVMHAVANAAESHRQQNKNELYLSLSDSSALPADSPFACSAHFHSFARHSCFEDVDVSEKKTHTQIAPDRSANRTCCIRICNEVGQKCDHEMLTRCASVWSDCWISLTILRCVLAALRCASSRPR